MRYIGILTNNIPRLHNLVVYLPELLLAHPLFERDLVVTDSNVHQLPPMTLAEGVIVFERSDSGTQRCPYGPNFGRWKMMGLKNYSNFHE